MKQLELKNSVSLSSYCEYKKSFLKMLKFLLQTGLSKENTVAFLLKFFPLYVKGEQGQPGTLNSHGPSGCHWALES